MNNASVEISLFLLRNPFRDQQKNLQGETDKPDSWFVSPEQTCSLEEKVQILYYKHVLL